MEVLFETEQTERDADAVRADAVLDDRGEAAFEIHRDRHQGEHDQEGQCDDLGDDDGELEKKFGHLDGEWGGDTAGLRTTDYTDFTDLISPDNF
jgi:hypothetical protein